MDDNQNLPDFSDIPALGDAQGLENFLNNETLAAQGIQVQQPAATEPAQPAAQPAAEPTQPAAPAAQAAPAADSITLTREQLNAILASRGQAPRTQPAQQPAAASRPAATYSAQEQQFITRAIAQGYSLDQINAFLTNYKGNSAINDAQERRIANIEQHLRAQEYQAAQSAFIDKLSNFGDKWGLSEQDLVTFGNEALKNGINIAMGDVNLEMVFRAIYPEQYAIRSRRMAPTTSSQIYGGTSIPEGSRANASKLEDAYVDNFLRGAMPNQYAASIKK